MNKKHSGLVRIFMVITLSIFVSIIILSTLLTLFGQNILIDTITNSLQKQLFQASYSTDFMLEYSRTMALQLYYDPSLCNMLFSQSIDWPEFMTAQNRLEYFRMSTPFIHSVYLYNINTEQFFVSCPYKTQKIVQQEDFFDKEVIKIINTYDEHQQYGIEPGNSLLFTRNIPKIHSDGKANGADEVYTLIFKNEIVNKSKGAAVILNISTEWLKQTIATMSSDYNNNVFAVDINGTTVIGNKFIDTLEDFSHSKVINRIRKSEEENGYIISKEDNEEVLYVYQKSKHMKWIFISRYPYNKAVGKIFDFRNGIIKISCIILLCGFIISFIISKYLQKPIKNIYEKMSTLQDYQDKVSETIQQNFLRTFILYGNEKNLPNMMEECRSHHLKLSLEKPYLLIILKIDCFKEFLMQNNYKQRNQKKAQIAETASAIFSESFVNEAVYLQGKNIAVILSLDSDDINEQELMKSIRLDLVRVRERIIKDMDIKLSSFVSTIQNSYAKLQDTYKSLIELTNYTLVHGWQCIVFEEDIKERNDNKKYRYPVNKEKALVNCIMMHNDVKKINKKYLEIVEDASSYSYDSLKVCLLNIITTISKTINVISSNNKDFSLTFDIKHFMDNLDQYETINEINDQMFNLFNDIASQHKKHHEAKYERLINKVEEIVEEQYFDKSLCLEKIAKKLGMSSAYFGRLYKTLTGTTIPKYIHEVRLKKACELLDTTDWSVAKIADEVGFSSDSYFFKVFKKHFGITPNEYRKKS